MTFTFAGYQSKPPPPCSSGPRPGAKALMAYLMERFAWSASYGIYNCRPPSLHSDGRAWDMGIPTDNGRARPELGMQVVNLLGPYGKRLGLTILIYNRQKWGAAYPDGKYYGGVHPHYDHIHMDMTSTAAEQLTYATLVEVLGSATGELPVQPTLPPYPLGHREYMEVTDPMTQMAAIRDVQGRLNAHRHNGGWQEIAVDGWYGPNTERTIQLFQRAVGITVDGVVGPQTWEKLYS